MKILSLCHYPIHQPKHGGQRRVDALIRQTRAAGHEVQFIPIFIGHHYPDASDDERATALPADAVQRMVTQSALEDVHMGQIVGENSPVVAQALGRMRAMAPDVIQFEQPWLYPVFADAIAHDPVLRRARLVYSSQNVEARLIDPAFHDEALAIEKALTRAADLVVAVSAADAAVFDGWRAPGQRPVVVAPNGCWAPDLTTAPAPVITGDYALVTGSAHPPNARGYWDCIGPLPGFLPPGTRLVVAGGMNSLLAADPRHLRFPLTNAEFVVNMGVVSEEVLTALLYHAKVICLPITEGGGTNLKTAEALMWLKPVVAMPKAMRGYDEAASLDGVFVARDPRDFRALLRGAMTGALTSGRSAADVARYGWPAQFENLLAYYAQTQEQG